MEPDHGPRRTNDFLPGSRRNGYRLSAHADYRELLDWLAASELSPKRVFVTHGEPAAADAFRRRLKDAFQWNAVVPDDQSRWKLE